MSIDQKLLESFSSDQVMLASNFLETIYIHEQTNIELNNDNEITVFSTLIQASAVETMKCNLFFSLSVNSQKKCFANLIYSDQSCLLLNVNNKNLLVSLFSVIFIFSAKFLNIGTATLEPVCLYPKVFGLS